MGLFLIFPTVDQLRLPFCSIESGDFEDFARSMTICGFNPISAYGLPFHLWLMIFGCLFHDHACPFPRIASCPHSQRAVGPDRVIFSQTHLFVAQRVNRVERGGLAGGVIAKEDTDGKADTKGE